MIVHGERINLAISLYCAESIIREFLFYEDPEFTDKLNYLRLFSFMVASLNFFLIFMMGLKSNAIGFKACLAISIAAKQILRFFEFFYYFGQGVELRLKQMSVEFVHEVTFGGLFINICGIFNWNELMIYLVVSLVPGCLAAVVYLEDSGYQIFLMLASAGFSLIDMYYHSNTAIDSFLTLIKIERKSLHLTQFVNRLLPKHVSFKI